LIGISGFLAEQSQPNVADRPAGDSSVAEIPGATGYKELDNIGSSTVNRDSLLQTSIYKPNPQDTLSKTEISALSPQAELSGTAVAEMNPQENSLQLSTNTILVNVFLLAGFGIAVVAIGTLLVKRVKHRTESK
jgi:hypothetical protein